MDDSGKKLEQFKLQKEQLIQAFGELAGVTFRMANEGPDRASNLVVWNLAYLSALEEMTIIMLQQFHANVSEERYLEAKAFLVKNIESMSPPDVPGVPAIAIQQDGSLEVLEGFEVKINPEETVH